MTAFPIDTSGAEPGAPDLAPLRRENDAIRVRASSDADLPFLWRLFAADEIAYRWIFRGRVPNLDTVRANLNRPNIVPNIIERVTDGVPLGYTVAYDLNYINGHSHIGTVIDPEHLGSGVGVSATILFADYMFAVLPFRKLYMRSIEYSFAHYRSLVARGYAQIEGVLKQYEYFGGKYWDSYIVSVDREQFAKLRANTRPSR